MRQALCFICTYCNFVVKQLNIAILSVKYKRLTLFYTWGHWGTKRLNKSFKATLLISDRARVQTQTVWLNTLYAVCMRCMVYGTTPDTQQGLNKSVAILSYSLSLLYLLCDNSGLPFRFIIFGIEGPYTSTSNKPTAFDCKKTEFTIKFPHSPSEIKCTATVSLTTEKLICKIFQNHNLNF